MKQYLTFCWPLSKFLLEVQRKKGNKTCDTGLTNTGLIIVSKRGWNVAWQNNHPHRAGEITATLSKTP